MMRTIDRYVAREFLRLFTLFALAAPLLFVIGDWTDNIDKYTERGLALSAVALGYVYQMPLFISWSFPVAALIATVFTVSNMARHSEMTAAKAGGISFFRALRVLPVLGVVLTGAGLGLSELVPITTGLRKEIMGEVEGATASAMRHEFVYTGPEGHVYTIRSLMMNTPRINGLTIEQQADDAHVMISAREAVYDTTGLWRLESGYLRRFADGSGEQAFGFVSMQLRAFNETPEQLMARTKEPEEMRYAELGNYIATLERSGVRPLKLMVQHAQKIAIPVATFVIILFGAPLANTSGRGGTAYGIGISLGITVLYMMLFRMLDAVGAAGTIPPVYAAWIPNGFFFLAALVLLSRVRT